MIQGNRTILESIENVARSTIPERIGLKVAE